MDRDRITPQYIESLKEDEVFVFGSNKEGMHCGGAAAKAFRDFGAEWGVDTSRVFRTENFDLPLRGHNPEDCVCRQITEQFPAKLLNKFPPNY